MEQPDYQYLPKSSMPLILSADEEISTYLVAGEYRDKKGKIKSLSRLIVLWGRSGKAGSETYAVDTDHNTALYIIKGSLKLSGYGLVEAENMILFEEGGNSIEIETSEGTQFLILSGEPIDEKVTQYGPYVMNTQTEILEAIRDYQMGKMGILIEED